MLTAVDRATDNTWFESAGRAGHVVSGVLHTLIAYVIVRVALGGNGNADQSGALVLAGAGVPAGQILLFVAAIGMATYGVYAFVMARHARM